MPLSKPMQMFAVRLTEEERANLERYAAERKITLSYAMREGLKLCLQDAGLLSQDDRVGEHVATT